MSSGSQTSLESAVSSQTTSESNTLRGSGSPTHSLSAHGPGGTGGTGHVRSPSMPFAGSLGVVRYDKFDAHEVKDLLVSFLYIVKHLHEGEQNWAKTDTQMDKQIDTHADRHTHTDRQTEDGQIGTYDYYSGNFVKLDSSIAV